MSIAKSLVNPNASFIVVGNKKDLKEERVVSVFEASKFCQDNDVMYLECSAYLGEGIDDLFFTAAKNVLNKVNNGSLLLEDKPPIVKFPEPNQIKSQVPSYWRYC